jgi:subtilisin family serine protease
VAYYSNFGPRLLLVAPGGAAVTYFSADLNIFSSKSCKVPDKQADIRAAKDINFGTAAGTSCSAPFVTGAVALMLSMNPSLTSAKIKELLIENTDKISNSNGPDLYSGYGRLNIYKTLLAVKASMN